MGKPKKQILIKNPATKSKATKKISKKQKQKNIKDSVKNLVEAKQEKHTKSKPRADMKPLLDALPSLDELIKLKNPMMKTGVPEFHNRKSKRQVKEQNVEFQEKVQNHKDMLKHFCQSSSAEKRNEIRRKRKIQGMDQ